MAAEKQTSIQRSALVAKLNILSMALAKQPVVPVFQCFMFDGTQVTAANDDVAITAPLKVGPFAIHGTTLLGLLELASGENVSFTPDETHVVVKTNRSTFKLPYHGEDEFLWEEPKGEFAFQTPISENLLNGFKAALLTVSNDLAKPALMGVCLLRTKEETALYSCDGDGMTKVPLGKGGKPLLIMMPTGFVEAVIKIMEDSDATKGTLSANDEWVNASFDNKYEVYGRLLAVDQPMDYDDIVAKTVGNGKLVYKPVPEGLDDALARAMVITKAETAPTRLTIEKNPNQRIKLLTENSIGTVRDSFTFSGHPECEANVSAELTARAIKLCPEMAVHANCVAYRHPDTCLFVLGPNMDK